MAMDEATLSGIIKDRLDHCDTLSTGQLAADRLDALLRYKGEPYGDEEEGRSRVVSRDVAEVVDGLMPGLMAVFASGDRVCVFEPHGPEDEDAAEQATDYVNWLLSRQNRFALFYVWFKDALLQRVGIVKSWWEVCEHEKVAGYSGLTPEEAAALAAEPDAEVIEQQEGAEGISLRLRRRVREGEVRVCNVPPEEFLIDRRAVDIDAAPFVAHRLRKTQAELIADGFDPEKVGRLPTGDDTFTGERAERQEPEGTLADRDGDSDRASRPIWITESYIRLDYDGDGIAELRKVVTGGSGEGTILLNEEATDGQPFSTLTPTIMPHKFFGKSVADDVLDIAKIKTALSRQMLDNVYLTNMPELQVVEDQIVDIDEWLTRRPGGIKRVKSAEGMAMPLTVPFVAGVSGEMLDRLDMVRAARTGFRPGQGSLDADALQNVAATTAAIADDAAHAREELIARTFAETGMKHLMRRLLRLVCQYQDKPRTVRLRGSWVPMDPRAWNADMDMSADVGLGSGSKLRRQQAMAQLVALTEKIVAMQGGAQGPLMTAGNVYEVIRKLVESLGLPGPERFITDPSTMPPQPPQEDPMVAIEREKLQLEAQKAQGKMQLDAQKAESDAAIARMKAEADITLTRERAAAELQITREESALKLEQMREEFAVRMQLEAQKAQLEAALTARGQDLDAEVRKETTPVREGGKVG